MSLASACVLLAAVVQGASAPATGTQASIDWTTQLAPRAAIAGLRGFECVSVVRFAAEPATPHELTCTYVFPDRVRWQLRVRGQSELGRHIEYRCGAAYFVLPQGEAHATEISARTNAESLAAKCEPLELRRALFLWPDGFEWSGGAELRRAKSSCGREVEALLGEAGRPRLVRWADVDAERAEVLSVTAWKEQAGRWWPDKLELSIGGQPIWSESVEQLATSVQLLDQFFVPPDLRPGIAAAQVGSGAKHVDTPSRHEVRFALPAGCDWKAAQTRWETESSALARRLPGGWALAPGAYAEVSSDGLPTALWARVRGVGDPPSGAVLRASQQALLVATRWPGVDLAATLRGLSASAPAGSKVDATYVGFPGGFGVEGELQVIAVLSADR